MTSRLRVLTANLLNGGADPSALARLVEAVSPDVVAVQELAGHQAEVLSALLPFGKLEPATDHTGMGIALREPGLVSRLALPRRGAWSAEVTAGAVTVEILNVHVVAPHVHAPWRTVALRRAQLRQIEAYLDASPPRSRALVGDLNSTPWWPLYRRLARRFRDAALEAARLNGHRAARTWGPWPGAPRLFRIDHVLIDRLVCLRARVMAMPGSDHSALVVDLGVPSGAAHPAG